MLNIFIKVKKRFLKFLIFMGIGDWGLGIGDWGLGIGPNPQSPIPNTPTPIPLKKFKKLILTLIKIFNKINLLFTLFNKIINNQHLIHFYQFLP